MADPRPPFGAGGPEDERARQTLAKYELTQLVSTLRRARHILANDQIGVLGQLDKSIERIPRVRALAGQGGPYGRRLTDALEKALSDSRQGLLVVQRIFDETMRLAQAAYDNEGKR
jgi:hypothetical protein